MRYVYPPSTAVWISGDRARSNHRSYDTTGIRVNYLTTNKINENCRHYSFDVLRAQTVCCLCHDLCNDDIVRAMRSSTVSKGAASSKCQDVCLGALKKSLDIRWTTRCRNNRWYSSHADGVRIQATCGCSYIIRRLSASK